MGETIQDWMGNDILNSVKKFILIYEHILEYQISYFELQGVKHFGLTQGD